MTHQPKWHIIAQYRFVCARVQLTKGKALFEFKMCIDDSQVMGAAETFSAALAKCNVSSTIASVLRSAQAEKRLTVGLAAAIHRLSKSCDEALFCLMAPSVRRDSAYHMQEVLLTAFCFENDICIVKVDSAEKLNKLLKGYSVRDCNCVLVHMPYSDPYVDRSPRFHLENLSPSERLLLEHCENSLGVLSAPIIKLPEE